MVVLSGKLHMEVGKDGFKSESGPWSGKCHCISRSKRGKMLNIFSLTFAFVEAGSER